MNSIEAKVGAVAVALTATWGTAHADDFQVKVMPMSDISNVAIATHKIPGDLSSNREPYTLSASLANLAAGSTYTTLISTSYSTATFSNDGTSLPGNNNQADFSVVATTPGGGVVVGSTGKGTFSFSDQTGGQNQASIRAGIVANSLNGVKPIFLNSGGFANNLFSSKDDKRLQFGTLYAYDGNGAVSTLGTYSVTPVPEPATFAALGLGALAMLRRRKRA